MQIDVIDDVIDYVDHHHRRTTVKENEFLFLLIDVVGSSVKHHRDVLDEV